DLAVANYYSSTVSVLLGNGDGTFSAPGQAVISPKSKPAVADVNRDGTNDVLVVDGAGDILYRQGIPRRPETFAPPVSVQPVDPSTGALESPSRDITWVTNTVDGPLLASVDADDDGVSLFAWRDGGFAWIGILPAGRLPAQIISADLTGDGRP